MTHKDISKFKFIVSSELHQFAYDLEQSKDNLHCVVNLGFHISISIHDENQGFRVVLNLIYLLDETSNVSGNYLEFSKQFKKFKQQAEKL